MKLKIAQKVAATEIRRIVTTEAIWCFAIKTQKEEVSNLLQTVLRKNKNIKMYLLVLGKKTVSPPHELLQRAISKRTNGVVTPVILYYETGKLNRIKGNHRLFIQNTVRSAAPLYVKNDLDVYFNKVVTDNYKAKKAYWHHCKYMAVCYLEAENAIENPNGELVRAVLLKQAIELICLGVLYACSGCRPNHFDLDYLIDLCAIFNPKFESIFPRQSDEKKSWFNKLALRHESLRYRTEQPSLTDIEILQERVRTLLSESSIQMKADHFDDDDFS